MCEELEDVIEDKIVDYKKEIDNLSIQLGMLNPKSILKRGYSISTDENGVIIRSIKDIKTNDKIITSLRDGKIVSNVETTKEN